MATITNPNDPNSIKQIFAARLKELNYPANSAILDILHSRVKFEPKINLSIDGVYNYLTPSELNSIQAKKYEKDMNEIYFLIEKVARGDDTSTKLKVLPFAHRFNSEALKPNPKVDVLDLDIETNYGDATKDYERVISSQPQTTAELIADAIYNNFDIAYSDLVDTIKSKGIKWQKNICAKHKLSFEQKVEINGSPADFIIDHEIINVSHLTARNGYEEITAKNSATEKIIESIFDKSLVLNSWLESEGLYDSAQYAVLLGHRNRFIVRSL